MLEIHNMNLPLNSILLLKERLIKVETLFEKYATLTNKYNDLEKSYQQSIENEKKAKKDATKYLEKYCKLSKKYDALSSEIENYEDTLKKKTNALEEMKIEYERIESLLEVYKKERSVIQTSLPENIKKDKDYLLFSTWRLFKESDRSKNRLAIAVFFKRFKNDLDDLKLEDFRNIKSNKTSKSSAAKETKPVLISHQMQIGNTIESDSIKSDSPIESEKVRQLDEIIQCCATEKCMNLEQLEYSDRISNKLHHRTADNNNEFLNSSTNMINDDYLNSSLFDQSTSEPDEITSNLYESSEKNHYLHIQSLEEIEIDKNDFSDMKNDISEPRNELHHKSNKNDFIVHKNKSNENNNFQETFVSPITNNEVNIIQYSDEIIENKLMLNYNTEKNTVSDHNNKTDLDLIVNKSLVNCKTYKKISKKSPDLHIKLENNLPISCENIDYVGSPSGVIILNTDIINGDLKILSNSFGMSDFNFTEFNSSNDLKQKISKITEPMPDFVNENNGINCQQESSLINKDWKIKSETVLKCESIFNIENERFNILECERKNSYQEIEPLEFPTENKNTTEGNFDNIVLENISEKHEKSKSTIDDMEKIHVNELKNQEQKLVCNTYFRENKEVVEARYEENNPNKSTDSKKVIQTLNEISDEEINKIFQSVYKYPLLSPIKDAEQKQNIIHKEKETVNNRKGLVNSEKKNEVVTKKNNDIIKISMNDIKNNDCNKLINQDSAENKLAVLKNISIKEKLTQDKFVQTDVMLNISKDEKFVQTTEISDKSKKLPITYNNIISKIFRNIKKEISLKTKSPNKRKIFDNFIKKCRDHCTCLEFVLILFKILNLPKLNYDKMMKFTVKVLKMMKMEKIKVKKKTKKKRTKNLSWKEEKKKEDNSVINENHSVNTFIVPETENVNKLHRVNENNLLNSVTREMECVNVFHHVIHSPYDLISSNRIEVLQRIQPLGFSPRIPQEIQAFNNNNSIRNLYEDNLAPQVMKEQNSQIVFDRYKQEHNNYIHSNDWVNTIMPKNNFVMFNENIGVDSLKAENTNLSNLDNCDKKNIEFAQTKIYELQNLSNPLRRIESGIENSNVVLELEKNSSYTNDSATLSDVKNIKNKVCKNNDLESKRYDDKVKNIFNEQGCTHRGNGKKNSINTSESKVTKLIESLNDDNKLFSKQSERLCDVLEAEREREEPFVFEEKDFYTPPIISPFRSEILDTEDDLDYSANISRPYEKCDNSCKNNTFQIDGDKRKSTLNVTINKLATFSKHKQVDEVPDLKTHRDVSNKLYEKLDEAENEGQYHTINKKRRISQGTIDLSCESVFEDRNLVNCKQRKKPIRQFQKSVFCDEPENLRNLPLQVDERKVETDKGSSVSFLDSILSAMTKQAEYFKPTVPVAQICDMNAVSFSAHQTLMSGSFDKTNLDLKQENEVHHNSSNISNNTNLNHSLNSTKEFQKECDEENVSERKNFESSVNYEEMKMKRLVEKAIKDFLNVEINSTIDAEEKMKPCIAILGKAPENIISKVIVAEIMTNVDEELQEFDRPAPPLTKTQHRLICILTVLTESNNQFSSITYNILKVIRSKIFPENFFWPDDALEMATRFYAALCKKLNNFKEIWRFCFKALTYMRQRWSIVVYVVLQIWPDILHDATKVKDNILVNTFVNLILHSSKSEDFRRKRQQNRLLALKHLLNNFYEFEINCTMEDFTRQIFESFFTDVLGADKALVLITKCRDWCWTKKHIIPKLTETVIEWADGKVDDIIGKKSLQIIHQICWVIPITDETVNSPTKHMISGLQRLLNSNNLNQISKEKVAKILCALSHHDNVKEILSSSLQQFSYNIELFKKMQKAILLSNSKKNKLKKIELKKYQNRPKKKKLKRKKKEKKVCSNSKTQEHVNPSVEMSK